MLNIFKTKKARSRAALVDSFVKAKAVEAEAIRAANELRDMVIEAAKADGVNVLSGNTAVLNINDTTRENFRAALAKALLSTAQIVACTESVPVTTVYIKPRVEGGVSAQSVAA